MIRAGTLNEAKPDSGLWVIVDIGFARATTKSCGIWVEGEEKAAAINFAAMVERVASLTQSEGEPLNLVIEAPLSVAFDLQGNPLGREIERLESGETRFWYFGLGTAVMVAAGYLVQAIAKMPAREVRLFEGFVSFKPKKPPLKPKEPSPKPKALSPHARDVEALRKVVFGAPDASGWIEIPKIDATQGRLISAFEVFGMDLGIPPVVFVNSNAR